MYRGGAPTTPYGSRGPVTPKSQKKSNHYSFPILTVKEILTCLAELNFSISEEELLHCDKHVATVRRIFENLLEALSGTRKEELHMPVFTAHQNMSWSQLHEDSVPELAFWRALSKLMFTCGVGDFSRSDIISPQPKRLRKQLSALINFVKFHEERMELYGRITAARDEYLDRLQVVTQENQQLQTQLEDLREETKVQREEISSLDEAIANTSKQINEKNQEQSSLRQQCQELKKVNAGLKEQLGEAGLERGNASAEIRKLQSQVVHSPERVRREMHESQRALQQERREGEAAEQAALVATTATKVVDEANLKVQEALAVAEEVAEHTSKWHDTVGQIKAKEAKTAVNRKEASEVMETALDVERQNARLQDKLQHLQAQGESKQRAAADLNEQGRAKLIEQQRKRRDVDSKISDEERAAEVLEKQIQAQHSLHESRRQELQGAWKALEHSLHLHREAMVQAMKGEATLPTPPEENATTMDHPAALPPPPTPSATIEAC